LITDRIFQPDDIDDQIDDVHRCLSAFMDLKIMNHEIAITRNPYDITELKAQGRVVICPEKCRKNGYPTDIRIKEPTHA
jgi:hypothetical protein